MSNGDSGNRRFAQPSALDEVALIDATTCAAAGAMSVSWWHEEVRTGRAPAPAVRRPRCTRWRMVDVRAFWIEFAQRAAADPEAAVKAAARAKKASAKAMAIRAGHSAIDIPGRNEAAE